jgi:hypothetical protein
MYTVDDTTALSPACFTEMHGQEGACQDQVAHSKQTLQKRFSVMQQQSSYCCPAGSSVQNYFV